MSQLERPASRTDVDSRRFEEIGKVQTNDWEQRIRGSMESLPTKTPPPKRRELKRNIESDRAVNTGTPEPPPPPTRGNYPLNNFKDPEFPPPPPVSDGSSKLSEESVGRISEENKENIVKQWVESTTKSAEEIAKELEKFAYDIAETVVSNMERSNDKKDAQSTVNQGSVSQSQMYSDFWEKQASISSSQITSQTSKTTNTNINNNEPLNELKRSGSSGSGLFFATPVHTTRHELHGPIYVQEDNRRTGMTYQQEERRREELRKQEEARQEEMRKAQLEEQQRKAREEELARKKQEYEQQQLLKRQEEEKRRIEEMKRVEEERRRQEELRRAEEEKRRQMEMKRLEEERKQQELLRYEQLKREEELKRQEEIRLELEMRKQYEMQQQKLKMEQQQQQRSQEKQSSSVRDHIPKIPKNKTFEASQDQSGETRHEDHLHSIKTGQVKEKRNFWMRSSSVDRVNTVSSLSPAPRRRRIDWNGNRQTEDPDSRPGSSLGQANTGSVRNLTSGFLAKSKSSTALAQDEGERGRPKQRPLLQNGGWTKEKYDQELKQEFFKSQELKTNKVNETVQTWGKRDAAGTTSGRSTPAPPSRHIGETFSENKIAKSNTSDNSSWRTKTPEPSLKLVNVSVEKSSHGSNQNIHISENAQKQMAHFLTQQSQTQQQQRDEVFTLTNSSFVTNTMSSQGSSIMSTSSTKHSGDMINNNNNNNNQPPPAPERNQSSFGAAVRYRYQ